MKLHLLFIFTIAILICSVSYAQQTNYSSYVDPSSLPLQALVKVEFTYPISSRAPGYLFWVADGEISLFLTSVHTLAGVFTISTESIFDGSFNPTGFYVTVDPSNIAKLLDLTKIGGVGVTQTTITTAYNASICASGQLSYYSENDDLIIANQYITNDSANCYIDQPALSYCNATVACPDGFSCVDNFAFAWGVANSPNSGGYWPAQWCMPSNVTTPISTLKLLYPVQYNQGLNATAKIAAIRDSLDFLFGKVSVARLCADDDSPSVPIISFQQPSDLLDDSITQTTVTIVFLGLSNACQGTLYQWARLWVDSSVPNIASECVSNIQTVSTPWTTVSTSGVLPAAVNSQYNCELALGPLAACESSEPCANDFRCLPLDTFFGLNDTSQAKVCQNATGVTTNVYNYNITITPTAANNNPDNFKINYNYLSSVLTNIRTILANNACVYTDSLLVNYVPRVSPYQSASLFVSHLNDSNDECIAIDLSAAAAAAFALTATSDGLFTTSVSTASTTVALNDCVDMSGALILGGSCPATAAASADDNVAIGCTSDADCSGEETCQTMNSGETVCVDGGNVTTGCTSDADCSGEETCQTMSLGETICVAGDDVVNTNLVRYTLTVKASTHALTATQIAAATEIFDQWVNENNCFQTSSASSHSAPIKSPYNVVYAYATNVNVSNSACLSVDSSDLTQMDASITGVQLTESLDSSCVSNTTILCETSACSQYIACDTGLYTDCSSDADCTADNSKLHCDSDVISGYSLCLVNAAFTAQSTAMTFVIVAIASIAAVAMTMF